MQFNQGASLVTLDGKGAGHIDRVVIDPTTKEITHLVIQRGLLQRQEKVVQIISVTSGSNGQLTVHVRSEDLEFLPAYEEEQYILVDQGQVAKRPRWSLYTRLIPAASLDCQLWPPLCRGNSGEYSREYRSVEGRGRVIACDEKEVGHVEQVLMSTPTDQVTHFVIAKGFLVRENRLIPIGWVDRPLIMKCI